MPVERIYGAPIQGGELPSGEPTFKGDPTSLRIGWGAESGHVEIAVLNEESPFRWSQVDGATIEDTDHVFDGWYMQLDRRQINQLIRHLRRARDNALGKDE